MTFSKKKQGEIKLSNLNILDTHQLYILELCKLIYCFVNNNLPKNINSLFQQTSSVHTHATRNSKQNGLKIPIVRSNKEKSCVYLLGTSNLERILLKNQHNTIKTKFQ